MDLLDILVKPYQTTIITKKKWYLKQKFQAEYFISVTETVKLWLRFCCHCVHLQVLKKNHLLLHWFIVSLVTMLLLKDKDLNNLQDVPLKTVCCQLPLLDINLLHQNQMLMLDVIVMHTGQKYVVSEVVVKDVICFIRCAKININDAWINTDST